MDGVNKKLDAQSHRRLVMVEASPAHLANTVYEVARAESELLASGTTITPPT